MKQRDRNGIKTLVLPGESLPFIGQSPAFLQQLEIAHKISKTEVTALLQGESGTGKELFAKSILYLGNQANGPFVAINCGAIPSELFENEIFGHERGAYTHAMAQSAGAVREAEGGTLFLDEIDSLPLTAQCKLLRFLQEKEFRPVGAQCSQKANVRLLTASNASFEEAVRSGRFRQDLYFRINVVPLRIPPLRERSGDIELLARHFLEAFAREFAKNCRSFTPGAVEKLKSYHWPGNVRELKHLIQRDVILSDGPEVDLPSLQPPSRGGDIQQASYRKAKAQAIHAFEAQYLRDLLASHNGNLTRAASAAQTDRRVLRRLVHKHSLLHTSEA